MKTPFDRIQQALSARLSVKEVALLPNKWEKIGDIAIIKLPPELKKYSQKIGETYAEVLECKTVLNDIGGISGIFREPNVTILYGSDDTTTVHKENGIKFYLDPQKVMFSSGNMDERIRMATSARSSETVVDLFAGVGYFSLPMAVYSKPKKIIACEINPTSYNYLCKNIALNHVTSIIEPKLGDNKKTSPKDIADRVILGYIENTHEFLPVAFNCLKNGSGIIHYHEICPDEKIPNSSLRRVQNIAKTYDKRINLLKHTVVKSYAPGISHIVLDVKIDAL